MIMAAQQCVIYLIAHHNMTTLLLKQLLSSSLVPQHNTHDIGLTLSPKVGIVPPPTRRGMSTV